MSIITEVRFGHENGALAGTLRALPELTATVVQEANTDPDRDVYLFRFDGSEGVDVQGALDADPTVRAADAMPGFDDRRIWGIEFADGTKLLAPTVTDEGGVVLDARSTDLSEGLYGWHERWLLPDREALHDIWQHAREEGFAFDVLEFHHQQRADPERAGAGAPTAEQREALVVAYERGYFAEPRETSLEELAELLDLSPAAVSGRLRRGMRALVGTTIATGDREPGADTDAGTEDTDDGDGDGTNGRR